MGSKIHFNFKIRYDWKVPGIDFPDDVWFRVGRASSAYLYGTSAHLYKLVNGPSDGGKTILGIRWHRVYQDNSLCRVSELNVIRGLRWLLWLTCVAGQGQWMNYVMRKIFVGWDGIKCARVAPGI